MKKQLSNLFECSLCDFISNFPKECTQHIRKHCDGSKQCCICRKELSSVTSLERHILTHSGERPYVCEVCSLSFTTNGNLYRHLRTHGFLPDQQKTSSQQSLGTFEPIVEESANKKKRKKSAKERSIDLNETSSLMDLELLKNLIENQLECILNQQTSNSESQISNDNMTNHSEGSIEYDLHKLSDHHDLSSFKKIKLNNDLRANLKENHVSNQLEEILDLYGSDANDSSICQHDSPTSSQQAIRLDPNDKLNYLCFGSENSGQLFVCKVCEGVVKSSKALLQHKTAHQINDKLFSCDICDYTTSHKSSLVRHLRIRSHTGKRPFECAICTYPFTTRANCERHILRKHSQIEQVSAEMKKTSELSESMTKSESKSRSTSQSSNLNLVLINNKPVECTVPHEFYQPAAYETKCRFCLQEFRFARVLKDHIYQMSNMMRRHCASVVESKDDSDMSDSMQRSASMFNLDLLDKTMDQPLDLSISSKSNSSDLSKTEPQIDGQSDFSEICSNQVNLAEIILQEYLNQLTNQLINNTSL